MANNDKSIPAGAIKLEKVVLTSYSGRTLDIRGLVREFSLHDNIQKAYITATLLISDATALLTQFPIIGQEMLTLSFKTPHSSFVKDITIDLQVIAVEKMKRTNSRSASYLLKCVPIEYIKDIRIAVRKSYGDMLISDMAKKLFQQYINSDPKKLTTSDTESLRTIVIPNMSPAEAMKFLASEAKSTDYPASNFCFYQNFDGFFFRTIDELIAPKSFKTIDPYYTTDFNVSDDSQSPLDLAASSGRTGGGSQQSTKPFEFLKMIDFEFIHLEQYDKITRAGGLESKMRIIDPALSLYEVKTYDYFTDYDKFKRTTTTTAEKFMLEQNEYIATGDSRQMMLITNKNQTNNYQPDQKSDFLQLSVASKGMLENIVVNVTIPGDSEKRAGDLVRLQFPEYGGTDDVMNKPNKFVSGKYLVTATRHAYTAQGYKTSMLCVKNAFEEVIK